MMLYIVVFGFFLLVALSMMDIMFTAKATGETGRPSEWEEISYPLCPGAWQYALFGKIFKLDVEEDVRIFPSGASGMVIPNYRHKYRRFVPR